LVKREVLAKIGSFDENFHSFGDFCFSSLEDVDLSWRALLAGYKILFEPSSLLFHKYVHKPVGLVKYYCLECGRYYLLLKNYRLSTLVVLIPALMFSELMSWIFVTSKGKLFIKKKISIYSWFTRNLFRVIRQRASVHKIRLLDDFQIMAYFDSATRFNHLFRPSRLIKFAERAVNAFFKSYYRFAMFILSFSNRRHHPVRGITLREIAKADKPE
jgi:hypothetical protein